MDYLLYLGIWFVFIVAWLLYQKRKARLAVQYEPFALTKMITRCKCLKCESVYEKPFKRFEYVNQTIERKCSKCLGKQKTMIIGIFHTRAKTKKELKWEKEFKKFQ